MRKSARVVLHKATPRATATRYGTTRWQPHVIALALTPAGWTNMPAAETDWLGGGGAIRRFYLDTTNFSEVMLASFVSVVGAATARIGLQYSPDNAAWTYADGTASGGGVGATTPQLDISSGGIKASAWATLPAGSKGAYWWRIVGSGGDGVADPSTTMQVLFR